MADIIGTPPAGGHLWVRGMGESGIIQLGTQMPTFEITTGIRPEQFSVNPKTTLMTAQKVVLTAWPLQTPSFHGRSELPIAA